MSAKKTRHSPRALISAGIPIHVSESEAAAILGVSVGFLQSDRYREKPRIPFLKIGARVAYSIEHIKRFIQQNTVQ